MEFAMILETVLTVSHRNASVECGFSIIKNLWNVNMSQASIMAQCLVKGHTVAALSLNILCAGNKLVVQRGFFKK